MRDIRTPSRDHQGRQPGLGPVGLPLLLVLRPPEPPELPITVGYNPGYDGMGRG